MDTMIAKRERLARYATKSPRAERLTAPGPSPTILPESAPGVPVLVTPSRGREFSTLNKRVMGAGRKVRFARDPRCGEAYRAMIEATTARQRAERILAVETADSSRFALEAALVAEGQAHDNYLAAQLGL